MARRVQSCLEANGGHFQCMLWCHISDTTNVLLFKFRCNMIICVGIIEEMPGLVGSGTLCTFVWPLYAVTGGKWVRPTSSKPFLCDNTVQRHSFLSALHTPRYIIQTNQPTRCNCFTSLLFDVYVWLNIFRASPRPSSGAYNCTRSLWFYRWREEAGALLVVVWPDHDQQPSSRFSPTVQLEGPSAVVSSWWWVQVQPARPRPTTLQPLLSNGTTRRTFCSCMLLMMGAGTPCQTTTNVPAASFQR
jgi:hypothetical protein